MELQGQLASDRRREQRHQAIARRRADLESAWLAGFNARSRGLETEPQLAAAAAEYVDLVTGATPSESSGGTK
jgi:hypothetical protein